jgi:hypothetical protein
MPSISIPSLITAGVSAAGSIGGALISSNGANSAAQTQANAANQAAQTQLQMYNQTRSDLSPFMSSGGSAMTQLANLFGFGPGGSGVPNTGAITSALTQFPGYQFGLQQGQTALDHSAASRGMALSGEQLKGAQQFGQNYAMQNAWQPYVSTLSDFARLGESAAAGVGTAGTQTGAGVAASQLAAGQATASGQAQNANVWGQAFQQGTSQLGQLANSWWPSSGAPATSFVPSNGVASVGAAIPEFY